MVCWLLLNTGRADIKYWMANNIPQVNLDNKDISQAHNIYPITITVLKDAFCTFLCATLNR